MRKILALVFILISFRMPGQTERHHRIIVEETFQCIDNACDSSKLQLIDRVIIGRSGQGESLMYDENTDVQAFGHTRFIMKYYDMGCGDVPRDTFLSYTILDLDRKGYLVRIADSSKYGVFYKTTFSYDRKGRKIMRVDYNKICGGSDNAPLKRRDIETWTYSNDSVVHIIQNFSCDSCIKTKQEIQTKNSLVRHTIYTCGADTPEFYRDVIDTLIEHHYKDSTVAEHYSGDINKRLQSISVFDTHDSLIRQAYYTFRNNKMEPYYTDVIKRNAKGDRAIEIVHQDHTATDSIVYINRRTIVHFKEGLVDSFFYDKKGRLIRQNGSDGYRVNCTYSRLGMMRVEKYADDGKASEILVIRRKYY